MACACRTLASALRQPIRRAPSAVAPSRRFISTSPSTFAAAPAAAPSKSEPAPPTSSCPAGTVIPGLNYLKDGADPVAKEDAEYPAWLWTLATDAAASGKKGKAAERDEAEQIRLEKKELKRERKVAIKAANTLKG
ncbi:hypothetical protein JCM8547_002181 [Rhodosporidiobolus lusitaniae]